MSINVKDYAVAKFTECNNILSEIVSYLNDANSSTFNKSKTLLVNEATTKAKEAINLVDAINNVVLKHLVPSEEALKTEVAHTLKEVGLCDMDDPNYTGIGISITPSQNTYDVTKDDLRIFCPTKPPLSNNVNDPEEATSKVKNKSRNKKAKNYVEKRATK